MGSLYTTAIRFDCPTAGNVDFDIEEVGKIQLVHSRDFQLLRNQFIPPRMYDLGSVYNQLNVELIENYQSTKAKIESLIDEEAEIDVYYQYRYDNTEYKTCILIPDNIRKIYLWGEDAAGVVHTLTFLESSV
jgi:hypothetical protein